MEEGRGGEGWGHPKSCVNRKAIKNNNPNLRGRNTPHCIIEKLMRDAHQLGILLYNRKRKWAQRVLPGCAQPKLCVVSLSKVCLHLALCF